MLKQTLILLLLLPLVFPTSINFQVQNQSCPDNANFLQVLYNLPTCIVEKFFSSLISGFVYGAEQFLQNALNFIIKGPDITLFCSPYTNVMKVLESLYSLALMGVGAYYIASAAEPEKMNDAKAWLHRIIFMIVALSVSYNLFSMILQLNQYITNSLYNSALDNLSIQATFSSIVFGFVISFNFILVAALTFFTLLIRYIMIPFLLLLFPVGIFLYFIPYTKKWGSFMLKFILLIVFMTSIDALLVSGLSALFSTNDPNLAGGFVQGMSLMLGFGLIGFVNLIIYLVAVLSVVGEGMKAMEGVLSIAWKIAMLAAFL
ncbi:hypothetical protein HY988_04605 [Candidatus Micrarchaeota archaeon]|nr:hypothetical protein [Candidatus Micrarchaeota archaeon]